MTAQYIATGTANVGKRAVSALVGISRKRMRARSANRSVIVGGCCYGLGPVASRIAMDDVATLAKGSTTTRAGAVVQRQTASRPGFSAARREA